MSSNDEVWIPLLDAALEEEIGMFVQSENRHYLENALYRLKADLKPTYDELSLLRPVIDGQDNILFIAKSTVELPE